MHVSPPKDGSATIRTGLDENAGPLRGLPIECLRTARPATVIHIGTPKAASSTLQSFLGVNYEHLRRHSVDFPLIGRRGRNAHQNFVAELQGAKKFKPRLGTLEELRHTYEADPCTTRIISAEMFESLTVSQIKQLKEALGRPGDEFIIVFVLRDLVDLLPSSYAQKIRGGSQVYDFDTFYEWRIGDARTDYFQTAARWSEVFGWERLRVRLLSAAHLVNGDLIDDFLALVGLDPNDATLRELPRPGVVNASIDWRVREAFRALYARRHGLESDHPLPRFLTTSERSRRKRLIEPLGETIGAGLGWTGDRGRYLTRAQAERAINLYRGAIAQLNAHLPEPLPLPSGLEERGFVERDYLPDAAAIDPVTLRRFYDALGAALDAPT